MRETLPLAGDWDFRRQESDAWRTIPVPAPWEWAGVPRDQPGPFTYRRRVRVPEGWAGKRIWLECDGVSYHAQVLVDGHPAGEHTGTWDAWSLELTGLLQPGSEREISLVVEKPASLTNGPDSQGVPGRFPLRETLSGFLPYVWG
ncbi:MAG TPA: hypothetical protein VNT60_08215, partial [Deinococcales bacterium]|nr:hypothetical protein [Deinococcales bacterium]